ncbi:MAG TPA: hypothetical protein VFG73_05510 [Rhodanobacteraceae bacterium]|nr:hypothetical protein [Rhodanobacteraceae bacterium]
MEPTTGANDALREELERRAVQPQAAQIDTAGLVRAGWLILILGWVLALVPSSESSGSTSAGSSRWSSASSRWPKATPGAA